MSNKKQTSLDFYRTELMALVSTGKTDYKTEPEIYEQAKELHKQEIIEAFWHGDNTDCISEQNSYDFAKEYYQQVFNQSNK